MKTYIMSLNIKTTLYKQLPICDLNTSFEIYYAIAMERMMNSYITHHRCDFITFYR